MKKISRQGVFTGVLLNGYFMKILIHTLCMNKVSLQSVFSCDF